MSKTVVWMLFWGTVLYITVCGGIVLEHMYRHRFDGPCIECP